MRSQHHKHPSPSQGHTSPYDHSSAGCPCRRMEGKLTASPAGPPPKSRCSPFHTHTDGMASGDFRSLSFGREWKPSACIGSVQNALQLMYSSLQVVLAADTTASGYGNNWIVGWRCFWGVGRAGAAGGGSTGRIVGDGHDGVACLGVVRLLPVNSNDRKIERYTDCRHGLDCAPVDGWR